MDPGLMDPGPTAPDPTDLAPLSPGDSRLDEVEVLFTAMYREWEGQGLRLKVRKDAAATWRRGMEPGLGRVFRLLVAMHGGRVVGFVLGQIRILPAYFVDSKVGHLAFLYVLPEERRRGVAARLARGLLAWFEAQGVRSVEGQVLAGNHAALEFWDRLGFEREVVQIRKACGEAP